MCIGVVFPAAPSRWRLLCATLTDATPRTSTRATGRLGSRLAGAILFLPAGRHSPLGRTALHGVESRPRRHGGRSGCYPWSSAAAHCGRAVRPLPLDLAPEPWLECWNPGAWREFLDASESDRDIEAMRENTHTGRPLGRPGFWDSLERRLGRRLAPGKGGRPYKQRQGIAQGGLVLE